MAPRWLDGLADVLDRADAPCYVVSEALAEEVTGFHVHRGALASLERRPLPSLDEVLADARSVLVLEDVVDHTNVGAIFRSGAALGFDAVLLAPRCADPLYRRSIKVAMGAVFALPWTRLPDWYDALPALSDRGFTTVALTLADDAVPIEDAVAGVDRLALVLGSEGHGLSPRWEAVRRPPRDHPDGRGHRLPQRRGRHRRRLLRGRPTRVDQRLACGRDRVPHPRGRVAVPPHPADRRATVGTAARRRPALLLRRGHAQGARADADARGATGGRLDQSECAHCQPSEHTIWADDLWHVNAGFVPMSIPYVGGLAPNRHCTLDTAPLDVLATLGILLQRINIAVKQIPGVARTHFARWGDGSEHFHMWALARPAGMMQGRGPMLAFWDDVLPEMPHEMQDMHLQIVAEALAAGGGTAFPNR